MPPRPRSRIAGAKCRASATGPMHASLICRSESSNDVVEELDRSVRSARVVDEQPDLEPVGRLGHPVADVGGGQVLHQRTAPRHRGARALPAASSSSSASVARDEHEIQSALCQLVGQAAPIPSDAPAMTAQGPYFCAKSVASRCAPPPVSIRGVWVTRRRMRHPSAPRTSSSS